jgi:uncharacterized protein (TIGR02466 family)
MTVKNVDSSFYYLGPLLYHTRLFDEDLIKIFELDQQNKKLDHRSRLAGHIKKEYTFEHLDKLKKILDPYLSSFNQVYKHWYDEEIKPYKIESAWINSMVAGEYNPIHCHINCDWSAVIFLKLPNGLKQEQEKHKGSASKPGGITFLAGPTVQNYINYKTFTPEVGDIFIFPKSLYHFVEPFKSTGERITLAFNLQLDTGDYDS